MARKKKQSLLDEMLGTGTLFSGMAKASAESKKRKAREEKQRGREARLAADEKSKAERQRERDAKAAERKREEEAKARARDAERARKEKARLQDEQQKERDLADNTSLCEAAAQYMSGLDMLHAMVGDPSEWKADFALHLDRQLFPEGYLPFIPSVCPYAEPVLRFESEEAYLKHHQHELDTIFKEIARLRVDYEASQKAAGLVGSIKLAFKSTAQKQEEERLFREALTSKEAELEQKKKNLAQEYVAWTKKYAQDCELHKRNMELFAREEKKLRETHKRLFKFSLQEHEVNEDKRTAFFRDIQSGKDEAIRAHLPFVLRNLRKQMATHLSFAENYLGKICEASPLEHHITFAVKDNIVYLRIAAPTSDVIPRHTLSVSESRGVLQQSKVPDRKAHELYTRFLHSFAFMYGAGILAHLPYLAAACIDLHAPYTDPATGKTSEQPILSVAVTPATCVKLNLALADAVAVYTNFKHAVSLKGGKPILSFQFKGAYTSFEPEEAPVEKTPSSLEKISQWLESAKKTTDLPAPTQKSYWPVLGSEKKFDSIIGNNINFHDMERECSSFLRALRAHSMPPLYYRGDALKVRRESSDSGAIGDISFKTGMARVESYFQMLTNAINSLAKTGEKTEENVAEIDTVFSLMKFATAERADSERPYSRYDVNDPVVKLIHQFFEDSFQAHDASGKMCLCTTNPDEVYAASAKYYFLPVNDYKLFSCANADKKFDPGKEKIPGAAHLFLTRFHGAGEVQKCLDATHEIFRIPNLTGELIVWCDAFYLVKADLFE